VSTLHAFGRSCLDASGSPRLGEKGPSLASASAASASSRVRLRHVEDGNTGDGRTLDPACAMPRHAPVLGPVLAVDVQHRDVILVLVPPFRLVRVYDVHLKRHQEAEQRSACWARTVRAQKQGRRCVLGRVQWAECASPPRVNAAPSRPRTATRPSPCRRACTPPW